MRGVMRRATWFVVFLAVVAGAFAAGGVGYHLVQRSREPRALELYGSVLRIAGRSPLALPSGSLAKQTDLRPLDLFSSVERRLRANYYEKIEDDTVLAFGTADNMIDSLGDPYSRFLEPDQFEAYIARQHGIFRGIGAVLGVRKEQAELPRRSDRTRPGEETGEESEGEENAWPAYDDPVDLNAVGRSPDGTPLYRYDIVIVATIPGGPAEAAKLRPGDVIRKVNGKYIFTKNLDTMDRMILMPSEGTVRLGIERAGTDKPIEVTVTMRETRIEPVVGRVTDGVGVVGLRVLGPGSAAALKAKLAEVVSAGANGVVLDLRRSAEGTFEDACAVASLFVTHGPVTWLKERGGRMRAIAAEPGPNLPKIGRLAVLVDNTTAGPAELVAAAVKSRGGRLFGTTTQGQASRQELFRVSGGAAILLTTALFFAPTPGGSPGLLEGKGVVPDLAVTSRGEAQDQALERAIAWIKSGGAA